MGSSITLTLVCCFPNKYSISCVWHRRVTRKLLFLSFSFHRRYGRDNQCLRYRNRMNMKQFLVVALSPFHLVRSLMFMWENFLTLRHFVLRAEFLVSEIFKWCKVQNVLILVQPHSLVFPRGTAISATEVGVCVVVLDVAQSSLVQRVELDLEQKAWHCYVLRRNHIAIGNGGEWKTQGKFLIIIISDKSDFSNNTSAKNYQGKIIWINSPLSLLLLL